MLIDINGGRATRFESVCILHTLQIIFGNYMEIILMILMVNTLESVFEEIKKELQRQFRARLKNMYYVFSNCCFRKFYSM